MIKKYILCFSRSYLANLLSSISNIDKNFSYLHIVQNDSEENIVLKNNGLVALNISKRIRSTLNSKSKEWHEPSDFRKTTEYAFCPISADRNLINFSKQQRLQIANILDTSFQKIFKGFSILAFISEPIALFPTHLLYYLCKKNKIKVMFWSSTYFPDCHYFSDGISNNKSYLEKNPDKNSRQIINNVIEKYVTNVISDSVGPEYHPQFYKSKVSTLKTYLGQRQGKYPLINPKNSIQTVIRIIRLIRAFILNKTFYLHGDYISAGAVSEHLFYLRCHLRASKKYDNLVDLSRNNVVFPLQFEPEASLTYFAPEVVSQIGLIELICKVLRQNSFLVVKEHPNQCGVLNLPAWQKLREKYNNLRFISGKESGRLLLKKSQAVITISSTMGMDALLLGRPVLLIGKVFYEDFPGVTKVPSINKIILNLQARTYQYRKPFMHSVEQALKQFSLKTRLGDPQPSENLFSSKNLKKLELSIHDAVQTQTR